jgi:hypothetical protein
VVVAIFFVIPFSMSVFSPPNFLGIDRYVQGEVRVSSYRTKPLFTVPTP